MTDALSYFCAVIYDENANYDRYDRYDGGPCPVVSYTFVTKPSKAKVFHQFTPAPA